MKNTARLTAGATLLILSAGVMLGWLTGNSALVQIHPSFAPMQFNTALCFMVSGIGILALVGHKPLIARVCGVSVFLIAITTLLQYLLNLNFGLDTFFIDPEITVKTSHPGRMSPNTTLGFLLSGSALVLHKNRAILISLAFCIALLALVSLGGYALGAVQLYGWGNLTLMALHTAVGFLLVAIGLALLEKSPSQTQFVVWKLAPALAAMSGLILSLLAWTSVDTFTRERNSQYFENLVDDTVLAIDIRLGLYIQALWGAAGFVAASEEVTSTEWAAYADSLQLDEHLSGVLGVGYIDAITSANLPGYLQHLQTLNLNISPYPDTDFSDNFIIRYIYPIEPNLQAIGLDIGFENNRRNAAETARDTGEPRLTKVIDLVQEDRDMAGFLLLVPVYTTGVLPSDFETRRASHKGWAYAPLVADTFLQGIEDISRGQISFSMYNGNDLSAPLVFSNARSASDDDTLLSSQTRHEFAGELFTFYWNTTALFQPPSSNSTSKHVLIFGLLCTFIVYLALRLLVRHSELVSNKVEERTAQLQAATQRAERASAMKSEFLANMSHELRTPLNGIIGSTDLLANTELTDRQLEYANIITRSGESLLVLINDILDLSKIEAGELEINPEKFVLRHVFKDAVQPLVTRAFEQNSELNVDYDPSIPYGIIGDPLRISQVVINLVGNAVKFTQGGSILVRVRYKFTGPDEIQLKVEVKDTGIGIEESRLSEIFNEFSQADASTTRQYGGTGLGLSISQRLVELMQGEIGVESKVGEGSNFWFQIPATIAQRDPPEKEYVTLEDIVDKRVLVIDPSATTRDIMISYLKQLGTVHHVAGTLDQASKLLQKNVWDVCFISGGFKTDIGEFIRGLQTPDQAKLKWVFVTSVIDLPDSKKLTEDGITSFVLKPIYPDDVVEALLRASSKQSFRRKKTPLERAEAKKARILVVEDDKVNQQIAKRMLESQGYSFDIAENGFEAIKEVQERPYNLVLMDVMMPQMDGYTATREIRKLQKSGDVADFPIIGLTANAMKEQINQCLEAGMNDVLMKPVRQKTLEEKLAFWLESDSLNSVPEEILQEPEEVAVTLDQNQLDTIKELMGESYVEFLNTSLNNIDKLVSDLEQGYVSRDLEAVRMASHSLVSCSAYVGAMAASALAREIENLASESAESVDQSIATILPKKIQLSKMLEQTKVLHTESESNPDNE